MRNSDVTNLKKIKQDKEISDLRMWAFDQWKERLRLQAFNIYWKRKGRNPCFIRDVWFSKSILDEIDLIMISLFEKEWFEKTGVRF